ncbi:MAG: manganese efflux pump [Halanaerobiales bacterium]
MNYHHIWPIFILGMAVSIDGFAVGITYGMRKISLRFLPLLLIGSISSVSIYLSITLGSVFVNILGSDIASKIGGFILIAMGIWVVYTAFVNHRKKCFKNNSCVDDENESNENNNNGNNNDINNDNAYDNSCANAINTDNAHDNSCANVNEATDKRTLYTFKIKSLGIIINILREPVSADFDKSGSINYTEAGFLGLALALDALGAGLGAGLTGYSGFWIPFLIGSINILFVGSGFLLGHKIGNFLPDYFEYIPGLIIISLGVFNFL